jgi:hypothetical protein
MLLLWSGVEAGASPSQLVKLQTSPFSILLTIVMSEAVTPLQCQSHYEFEGSIADKNALGCHPLGFNFDL